MVYVFGDHTLDTQRYTLRRAGQDLPLEGLAFDLLVYLVQHRDRVVSREELQREVWKREFLSPNAVDQCVAVVRRTLTAPHRATPTRYIQTVRGRGYRFVGTVEESAHDPSGDQRQDVPPKFTPTANPPVPPAPPIPVPTPRGRGPTRRARVLTGLALAAAVLAVCGVWFWPETPLPEGTHDGPEMPGGAQVPRDPPPPHEVPPRAPAPGASPSPSPRETLSARFAAAVPSLSPDFREDEARRYDEAKPHKAQAVSLQPAGTWRAVGWESAAVAAEKVLEGCQVRYGQPCALVSVDETMQPSRPGGDWPRRHMARVTYEGYFRPELIPAAPKRVTQRADIAGYALAAGPKALAVHPWGRAFAVTGATTQRAAEEQALATCNADPDRKGVDGPCYLYAVGNYVILPQRHTEPRKPATTIADVLTDIGRKSVAERYAHAKPHKALAVQVDTGRWFRWYNVPTAAAAEQHVLEACQLTYGTPCVLVAVDDSLRTPDLYSAAPRDMPRLTYAGPYRPAMVPLHYDPKQDKTISEYPKLKQPKAMAIRPNGKRIATAVGKTVAEAEGQALAACNEPESAYPCFLYAVNDRVVLPQRRTEPRR
jgi:DNA-binding winged helix-turn-helix (wHTH) protein